MEKTSLSLLAFIAIITRMISSVSATCNYGEIRLVNGGTIYEGRVEVCVNNQWGTVCDDFWTNSPYQNAKVACRQLGFSDEGAVTRASNPNDFSQLLPPFGQGTGPILWDDVQCSGSELRLSDCPHINHTGDCIRSEDVGVTCQPPPPEPPTVATTGDSSSLSSTVDTTTTTTNQPLSVPDVFVVSPSTPDPQRIDNGSKASEGNQTSTSGLNVENMVVLSQTHIIIIAALAVMFALILATAVCITFLLVMLKLKRKRRAKSDNIYEDPIDAETKGTTLSATHPGSGKLTGNVCYVSTTEVGPPLNLAGPSIETQPTPGSGELGENVCYASTTFKQEVRPPLNLTRPSIETQATEWNVAYGSVEMAVTIRNDHAVLYETIDETRMGRRDARNNQC